MTKNLEHLTPSELISACGKDINLSLQVFKDDLLLNKLGCHKEKGKLFGSSHFWQSFNPELDKDPLLSQGFYLFEFLKLDRKLYELALERKITDRLSEYQLEALENYFYNENNHQFYKKNIV